MNTALIMVEPDMRAALAGIGLATGEDFLTRAVGTTVCQSASSVTRRIQLNAGGRGTAYFLKIYPAGRGAGRWRPRRPKACIEAANLQTLHGIGISAPEVVCHGHRIGVLGHGDSFILTRDVSLAARPLDEYVDATWPGVRRGAGMGRRRSLILATALLVRRMHDAGFFHIDLQWRNILVAEEAGAWRLWVIDSPRGGTRTWGLFREHGRLRDLSSFAKQSVGRTTRCEQIRWLRAYLGTARLTGLDRDLPGVIARDRASKDNSHRT